MSPPRTAWPRQAALGDLFQGVKAVDSALHKHWSNACASWPNTKTPHSNYTHKACLELLLQLLLPGQLLPLFQLVPCLLTQRFSLNFFLYLIEVDQKDTLLGMYRNKNKLAISSWRPKRGMTPFFWQVSLKQVPEGSCHQLGDAAGVTACTTQQHLGKSLAAH